MAYATLAVQEIDQDGLDPAYVAAVDDGGDGHKFVNDGRTFLHVKNGGGGSINVTVHTDYTRKALALADQVVAVPAGGERKIGPLPALLFNQKDGADAGSVYVDYSAIASVTVGAFQLP